jgi:hypothetical protein
MRAQLALCVEHFVETIVGGVIFNHNKRASVARRFLNGMDNFKQSNLANATCFRAGFAQIFQIVRANPPEFTIFFEHSKAIKQSPCRKPDDFEALKISAGLMRT